MNTPITQLTDSCFYILAVVKRAFMKQVFLGDSVFNSFEEDLWFWESLTMLPRSALNVWPYSMSIHFEHVQACRNFWSSCLSLPGLRWHHLIITIKPSQETLLTAVGKCAWPIFLPFLLSCCLGCNVMGMGLEISTSDDTGPCMRESKLWAGQSLCSKNCVVPFPSSTSLHSDPLCKEGTSIRVAGFLSLLLGAHYHLQVTVILWLCEYSSSHLFWGSRLADQRKKMPDCDRRLPSAKQALNSPAL